MHTRLVFVSDTIIKRERKFQVKGARVFFCGTFYVQIGKL